MNAALNYACDLALLLRNFFAAASSEEILSSYQALARFCGNSTKLTFEEGNTLEYAFNRLFVGPLPPIAPPYSSIYLDSEPQLMGQATLEIRDLLRCLGLSSPTPSIPDDFLPYELELWHVLANLPEKNDDIRNALYWLIDEHLSLWLPKFIQQARHEPIVALPVDALEKWLQQIQQRSLYE